MTRSPLQARWRGAITFFYDGLGDGVGAGLAPEAKLAGPDADAPAIYGSLLQALAKSRQVEYGELTFFGDTRYSPQGRAARKTLDRAAERLFRNRLKMPVDVYEGPAMNHSYHEMIIGHGKCFSTILISDASEQLANMGFTADYHRAQFLATLMALAQRQRSVVAIVLRDLEAGTLGALEEFFHQAAKHV